MVHSLSHKGHHYFDWEIEHYHQDPYQQQSNPEQIVGDDVEEETTVEKMKIARENQ